MKSRSDRAWLFVGILAALASAPSVSADGRNPGSLLVFPEFDNRPGHNTLWTVSNTNGDPATGSIRIEIVYLNGSGAAASLCSEFNSTATLTPNDSLTVLTSAHNPGMQRGFAYVFAKSAQGSAVSFNWLIGEEVVLDGVTTFAYAVNPVSFLAVTPQGSATDVDHDGLRDMDGVEYEMAPAKMLIPRFTGQDASHASELIFIGLTGGRQFTTILDLLVYNDNEEVFSGNAEFRCWDKIPLTSISNVFGRNFLANFTSDNPSEIIGATAQEAGWIEIDGLVAQSSNTSFSDPAFLAVLSERTPTASGSELSFELGTQSNGVLLPQGPFGN